MNLGERVSCKRLNVSHIGVADRKVETILTKSVDAETIVLSGTDLQTTLTGLAGGSATADWSLISNKPANLVDWTQDQGDVNINANNLPLLNYAPNTLASNGTAGLSSFNFNQSRKDKLAGIAENADVTPLWVTEADPGYITTAAISGKQDTLSNGVGVSIQNNSVNIAQDVGPSSNVQFGGLTLSGGISSAGTLQIYDAFPATNAPVFTVNNLTGNVYAAPDQNTSHEFGKMKIGYIGLNDIAAMSHYDMANSTDYAVLQSQLGGTVVNAKLGQKVSIYNNGSDLTAEFFNTGINLKKDTTVYGNLTLESVSSQIQTITASKIATWDALAASSTSGTAQVAGSSINAGIYKYINWKEVPSSTSYTRYDFFRVPRISSLNTVRLMYLTIQSEFRNDVDAFYQEEIVKWNDRTGEILALTVTNHLPGATPVATAVSAPTPNSANSNKIWIWEDNTNVYVSFINLANSAHRMLIQLKLFNVRHADGGVAFVL